MHGPVPRRVLAHFRGLVPRWYAHKWRGRLALSANAAVELATNDLLKSADWAAERWAAFPAQRWDATHATVEWTPRRTLDHLVDVMLLYSAYVATRAQALVSPPRNGDPSSSPARWSTPSDQASSYSRDCSTASGTTSVFPSLGNR